MGSEVHPLVKLIKSIPLDGNAEEQASQVIRKWLLERVEIRCGSTYMTDSMLRALLGIENMKPEKSLEQKIEEAMFDTILNYRDAAKIAAEIAHEHFQGKGD